MIEILKIHILCIFIQKVIDGNQNNPYDMRIENLQGELSWIMVF